MLQGEQEDRTGQEGAGARKDAGGSVASEEAREQRLVNAIDDSIRDELELLERIRRLEEIEQALRAQLTTPAPQPTTPPTLAAPPVKPAGTILEHAPAPNHSEATTQIPSLRPAAIPVPARPHASTNAAPAQERSPAEAAANVPATSPPPPRADLDFDAEVTSPLIVNEEIVEEHDSAVELADIMISFGRVQGAAETLSDFIRANPRQSVAPWVKLMEVYRLADMRIEFDALARQLNKTFNVKTVTWDNFDEARKMAGGLEQLPHAIDQLVALWGTTECQAYLDKMLRDNRDGTRQGLSLGIIDDILMLWSVLEDRLGRFRGDQLNHAA